MMEPRHFDQRDEEVSEAPWGEEPRARRAATGSVTRSLRAALERYRIARAALRAAGPIDDPLGPVDAIAPIASGRIVRARGDRP